MRQRFHKHKIRERFHSEANVTVEFPEDASNKTARNLATTDMKSAVRENSGCRDRRLLGGVGWVVNSVSPVGWMVGFAFDL